jgi:hypothetical protein
MQLWQEVQPKFERAYRPAIRQSVVELFLGRASRRADVKSQATKPSAFCGRGASDNSLILFRSDYTKSYGERCSAISGAR